MVGEVEPVTQKLLKDTKLSLFEGIHQVKPGNRIGDVSFAVQNFVEKLGYGVVRELVGHGVGRNLHEALRYLILEKEVMVPSFRQVW